MFQFRRFPSCTYGFSTRYTSFTCVDCSIRKSMDQCPLTAPRGLSQLVASFFGSQCQGIPLALFVAWPCDFLGSSIKLLIFMNKLALWNCSFSLTKKLLFLAFSASVFLYPVFNVLQQAQPVSLAAHFIEMLARVTFLCLLFTPRSSTKKFPSASPALCVQI